VLQANLFTMSYSVCRVAITMSPGENMRCNQTLYQPDASVRSSHFKDYAHCTKVFIFFYHSMSFMHDFRSLLCRTLFHSAISPGGARVSFTVHFASTNVVTFSYVPKDHPVIKAFFKNLTCA